MSKNKGGRPTVVTPDVLAKLNDAFAFCYSDIEACLYAGISVDALYDYQKKNPQFAKRKEMLRKTPNLKAKKTLVENVGELSQARWWAEHKMSDEFGTKNTIAIEDNTDQGELDEANTALVNEFEEKMRVNYIKAKKK